MCNQNKNRRSCGDSSLILSALALLSENLRKQWLTVEKCPRCGSKAEAEKVHFRFPFRYAVWSSGYKNCCLDLTIKSVAFTRIGAVLRWNRWARREARRIEREKK